MGPMKRINRLISSMFQGRGRATCSSSTASMGIGTCEKSYRRLLVNTWIGAIGMKGRKALAPSTLNMLPKLELAPMRMYLRMLAKTLRPSMTPPSSTMSSDLNEREKGAGSQHAEHVAEVGTRPHADVLENVSEDFAALDDSPFQHHEVLFEQDQIRRLLGDVGSRVDRDADVRSSQGGSIVDAVAHESDDVALTPESANDPLLVGGREAGEQRGLLGRIGQLGIGHFLDVRAQQHGIGRKSHVLAHLAADQIVVAGENLNSDAMLVKGLDGRSRGVLGRVQKRDVPFEHKVAFIIL